MSLSRKDIDERVNKINTLSTPSTGLPVDVDRRDGHYKVFTLCGCRRYDTIKEVLSFLDGYYLAVLLENNKI